MGLIKKSKKDIFKNINEEEDLFNNEEENINEENINEENINEENINEENINEENINEENINEENINKKPTKKVNKLTKKQLVIGSVAIGSVVLFSMLNNDNPKKSNNIKKDLVSTKLKINNDMTLIEASKNKDFLSRLKILEKKIETKNYTKASDNINIVKIQHIKYNGYKELSELIFYGKYSISNNEYFYRKNNDLYHHIFHGNEIELKNMVAIPFKHGALIKLNNLNTDYIIEDYNKEDKNFKDIKNIKIWRIDSKVGLKQEMLLDTKKDIISYLQKDKKDNENDIFIKQYRNQIVLIGNNAEIKQEIDFYSSKTQDISLPKKIIKTYLIKEYLKNDFTKVKIKDNKLYNNNNQLIYKDNALYSMKYIKYNDLEKGISEDIFILKNGKVIKKINLNNIRAIILINYKSSINDEYVNKKNIIYKLNQATNELEKIGKGSIYGRIENNKLKKVSLIIEETTEQQMPINNLINKTLIDENGIEYKITEDGVQYQGALIPIEYFSITPSGYLFYKKTKITKIKEIKLSKKTGAEIITAKKKIKLYSKTKYTVTDINDNFIFNEKTYKKVSFKLNYKEGTIEATATIIPKIDEKNKTVNDIKYETKEERNNEIYLYDSKGEIIKKLQKIKQLLLFKEDIKNFNLIDGEMFDYYFEIDTKTGKIKSNTIGKFIKKYDKDKIPFSQFMSNNKFTTSKRLLDTKLGINNYKGQTIILLSDLLENKSFPYITFVDNAGNNIKILDEKHLIINNKDQISAKKIYLNQMRKKFLLNITNDMLDRNIKRKYKIKINNKQLDWFYKKIELDNLSYINRKKGIKLFKVKDTYYLKLNKENNFNEIISMEIDLLNDNLILNDVNDKKYNIRLSDLVKMTKKEEKLYTKLLNRFLHPKESDESKLNKEKEERRKKERLKKSKEFQKQMKEFEAQTTKMTTIKLAQSKINKIKAKEKLPDFTFEIGTKLKYTIKESMEVVEGEKGFALGHINNVVLRDLSGNIIDIKNANIVLGLEGDFSKQKIKVTPLKIIYKDVNTNQKRVIDIPQSATQFVYKEDGYSIVDVPAYMINAKLKNINTTVILSTVSGILKNLTTPQDPFSQLTQGGVGGVGTTGVNGASAQNQTIGQAAGAGINTGIQDLIKTIKASADKEKNILISEPKIKGYSLFIEEVEVSFDDKSKK